MRITNQDGEKNQTVTLPLHRTIFEAIRDGDAGMASEAMKNHLEDSERRRAGMARRAGNTAKTVTGH